MTAAPFCSPECRTNNGWRLDPDTLAPVDRCPCRYRDTPTQARDDGIGATTDANPQAMRAALAIIRETAQTLPEFTANDTRLRMKLAQIPGPVIGAAFRQAVKDRVLQPIGYEPSTDGPTHAHPVHRYVSLKYGRTA